MKTFHENRLPHIAPIGATFFVTFRLADSLPQHIIKYLQQDWEEKKEAIKKQFPTDYKKRLTTPRKLHFKNYEHQLDTSPYGSCILRQPKIAQIVVDKLKQYDGKYYDLLCYCIMPNRVHFLADFSRQLEGKDWLLDDEDLNYTQLDKVMKYIKGGSARSINLALNTSGTRWAKDSYDHYVRDGDELWRIVGYILRNPVAAGLVEQWEDWPFSYRTGDL